MREINKHFFLIALWGINMFGEDWSKAVLLNMLFLSFLTIAPLKLFYTVAIDENQLLHQFWNIYEDLNLHFAYELLSAV